MGARLEIPPYVPQVRWITPYALTSLTGSSATATVGRVWLVEFETPDTIQVDAIVIKNEATVAGNVIVGIYGPIVTEETCAGSPLLIQSSNTVLSGTSSPQTISINQTTLVPGRYYVAIEYSNVTHTYGRGAATTFVNGWSQYYDRGGGYGALTDPCPAVTNSNATIPNARIRGVV